MKSDKLFSLKENRTELPTLGSVFYESTGTGPSTLVLIHGFPFDRRLWYNLIPELQNMRVIIPDLPGVGNSTLNAASLTMDDYATCIARILEVENVADCIMAGHSMGGYVALAFAKNYPDKLNGLSLVHSTAFADEPERKQKRDQTISFLKANSAFQFTSSFIPGPFAPGYQNEEEIKKLIHWSNDCTREGLIAATDAMKNRNDQTGLLQTCTFPVQWIIGKLDPVFPYTTSFTQAVLSAQCMINLLEGCGHMGMIEKPLETAQALQEFADYCNRKKKLKHS